MLLDPNVEPLLALAEEGITRGDIEAGVRAAMAKEGFRIRYWNQLLGWIRTAAKERLESAPKASGNGSKPPDTAGVLRLRLGIETTEDNVRNVLKLWKERRYYPPPWGPEPDRPGCIVPRRMLDEAGIEAPPAPQPAEDAA